MKKGKVWLVGAGPWDVGLFTLKGKKVLEQADVVVYDRLVGHGILAMIPKMAETINVGKAAGNHTLKQEQINELLRDKALAGNRVVRLKGGDPFLFGRGGEEVEVLLEAGIPYEIVPGVTSAISVPAYQGIPVTHRDYASSVHIITAHKKQDEALNIDFEALHRAGGTYVFLMGVSALPDICSGFLKAGMLKNTPAAILERGTTAKQRRVSGTIQTLPALAKEANIKSPGIIVIGDVVGLADEFDWYGKLPLAGCKVLVTRPKELVSALTEKLRNKGAEVLELPSIQTVPKIPNDSFLRYLEEIASFSWLVFTSPGGVKIFYDTLKVIRFDIRKLAHMKIAAVGPGTKRQIEERGMFVDFMPKSFDGKSLGIELGEVCSEKDRIMIPRAELGSPDLVDEIHNHCKAEVCNIAAYETVYDYPSVINEKREMEMDTIDYAVFTSASTVKGFASVIHDLDLSSIHAVCIGKQTLAVAKEYGMIAHMADKPTLDALVSAVEQCHRKNAESRRG